MAKSKIIKELASNEITLDIAFKRLMILASDLDDESLKQWAEMELSGYKNEDSLPDYRYIPAGTIYFSGVKGFVGNHIEYKHNIMQPHYLSYETWEKFTKSQLCRQDISSIQKMASDGQTYKFDITRQLVGEVYERTDEDLLGGIGCTSISMEFSNNHFAGIIQKISTRLLDIFIQLDKEFGNLDDLDIDISNTDQAKVEEIKQSVQQIIFNSATFNNFEKAKIKNSNLGKENKIDNRKDKKAIKDSNIGKGSNAVSKQTSINPTIELPINKSN